MLPSASTSSGPSTSSSVATVLGLTQIRKRTTPVLNNSEKTFSSSNENDENCSKELPRLPSPSSVYSPGPEGAIAEYEENEDEDSFGGIRLVEDSLGELGSVPMERSQSVNTLDKPWLGRSISYRPPPTAPDLTSLHTGFRLLPALTPLPRGPSLPFPTRVTTPSSPLTLPRAPSRASTISFASLARPLLATTASQKRRAAAKEHEVTMRRAESVGSFRSVGASSTMSRSSSLASSFKVTEKWPDAWYMTALAKGKLAEGSLGESVCLVRSERTLGIEDGKWTRQKWLLLISVTTLFGYGLAGLACALVTWFRTWPQADVVIVTDAPILLYLTLASMFCLLTALIGLVGTMLNSRAILAVYAILLWPAGLSILVVGYASYKKETLALDLKLNQAWSQWYDDLGRLRIQDSLHCCGYYSPFHEATFSKRCYPRTSLPGCKAKLYRFEREILRRCWLAAFGVTPFHIINIFVATICANHVNRTFGKGLMPRQYRLNPEDVSDNALSIMQSLPPPASARRRDHLPIIPLLSYMPSGSAGSGLVGLGVMEVIEEK